MLAQEIIAKKRDNGTLTENEIASFIGGVTAETVTEGQVAAFCMAVLIRGMDMRERVALTRAMMRSGSVLDWSSKDLGGPVLDKHSTGGVGDKVSLILGPAIAACGGYVPMISGRGLGHTGGTLDKLDSIPGYRSLPDNETLERVVRSAGCAIIGATKDIAPADKRIYAIRDTTGTVESLDLITASILSKKLAAGLQGLVMDVKFGSGAFKPDPDDAAELAQSLVTVANGAGLPTVALMTDMNQILGRAAGNAVEVRESLDFLTGRAADPRLREVTVALAAELLVLGGLAADVREARARVESVIDGGEAADRFARMVAALGGPKNILATYRDDLPGAPLTVPVHPAREGVVTAIDTRAVGVAIVEMGGGRKAPSDTIDPAVGLTETAGIGEAVGPKDRPLALLHARDRAQADRAADALRRAFSIGDKMAKPGNPVARKIG